MEIFESVKFKVVGTLYRDVDEIINSLFDENELYTIKKKELIENGWYDTRIYKYELCQSVSVKVSAEPDNEADPNALAVYADGIKIGYMQKSKQKQFKKILLEHTFAGYSLEGVYGPWVLCEDVTDWDSDIEKYDVSDGETEIKFDLYVKYTD